jgi:nitrous oxidase accessory protein
MARRLRLGRARTVAVGLVHAAIAFGLPAAAVGATLQVAPGGGKLQAVVNEAAPGDVLQLLPGSHLGPVVISKPLTVAGVERATVVGNGAGSTIIVEAPDVTLRGLTVTGSGLLLETQDSGIFLSKEATGARVIDNRIVENLIGIYVWGARDAVVASNTIVGRRDLRMNERGNGIQVWNAPGAKVEGNDIRYGRDGIFVTTSKENTFRNNRFRDLRFGMHYMYTNKSHVEGNISQRNHIGYAIMYSKVIDVGSNRSENDRDRGILFNYANSVSVHDNVVTGGPEKCVFIYNSNKNTIVRNLLSECEIGIHFTAGSERNVIVENAFVSNRRQVKYVGTRWLDWSTNGKGNYWSDHAAFDFDNDGIADRIYKPNDLTDQILWRHPAAKLLVNSPAVQILKWAQAAFPALFPGGVVDSAPLMSPPRPIKRELEGAS